MDYQSNRKNDGGLRLGQKTENWKQRFAEAKIEADLAEKYLRQKMENAQRIDELRRPEYSIKKSKTGRVVKNFNFGGKTSENCIFYL